MTTIQDCVGRTDMEQELFFPKFFHLMCILSYQTNKKTAKPKTPSKQKKNPSLFYLL